jgi:hypothetical protein
MTRFLCAVLLIALTACAGLEPARNRAHLAPDLTYEIPGPAALAREIEAAQIITARYKGETFTFESRLKVTRTTMLLAGVDGVGRRIMTISWSGSTPMFERAEWFPADLRPENILADITLMYWPEAAVRDGLANSTAIVTRTANMRTVSAGGQEIVTIRYSSGDPWSGITRLHNALWGYDLEVRSELLP